MLMQTYDALHLSHLLSNALDNLELMNMKLNGAQGTTRLKTQVYDTKQDCKSSDEGL